MTFDGIILHASSDERGTVSSYAHFYRNGIFEAVDTTLLETCQVPGQRLIPHVYFEDTVLKYLPRCFHSLQRLGVQPPVSLSLTLIGIRGLRMAMPVLSLERGNEIREESLSLPGVIVDNFTTDTVALLKPMFDRIWNACGILESPNFNTEGLWSPRRIH